MTMQCQELPPEVVSLPRWAINAARRLASLNQPGAYSITFVVEPDGQRRVVVPSRPDKMEELGKS